MGFIDLITSANSLCEALFSTRVRIICAVQALVGNVRERNYAPPSFHYCGAASESFRHWSYWTELELISSLIRLKDHPRTLPRSGNVSLITLRAISAL